MKIDRISKIKSHRIFKSFIWKPELENFGTFNLIFGWNGSGKSTLSRLFRHLERRENIIEGEVQFQIEGRSVDGSSLATDSGLPAVRVFNRDFVLTNVFRSQSNDDVAPIFFLGADSVDKQKEVEALEETRKEKRTLYSEKDKEKKSLDAELEAYSAEQARTIKELLRSSGPNLYNNYDKRAYKAKCEELLRGEPSTKLLSEAKKDELKKRIRGTAKAPVSNISINFPDIDSLRDEVASILKKTVISQVIEELTKDAALAKWVRDGLPFHIGDQVRPRCGFCGNEVPADRISKLQAHFNDHYNSFLSEVSAKVQKLEATRRGLRISPPVSAMLYDHLASQYEEAVQKIEPYINQYELYLGTLVSALEHKYSKPFEEITLTLFLESVEIPDSERGMASVTEVNKLIDKHNKETRDFNNEVATARKDLEECLISEVLDTFKGKVAAAGAADAELNRVKAEGTELVKKISDLNREITEHRRPADELNQELRNYLGHSELKFDVMEKGYSILRNGSPAEHLSEGEATAIAFLYFLKSLSSKDFDLKKEVVVIDDPVSSLDTNALFCAFAYMREQTKSAGQLFVLTHNANFFRQVKNWFHHINRECKKTDPPTMPARFFMTRASVVGDQRFATITALDKLLSKYESDYHYLFKQVYEYSCFVPTDGSYENLYGLPNIARRLLETFFAFRYPAQTNGLSALLSQAKFDPARKARILRLLHTFSHDGVIGEGEHDLSALAETPQVLKDVMDLIQSEDEHHFKAMKALSVRQ